MRCLSCQRPLSSKQARLWQKKILLCAHCCVLADNASAELEAASHRAHEQARMWLEQQILGGGLLAPGSGMDLPGIGRASRD